MAMRNRHINTQEPPSCWNYESPEERTEQDVLSQQYWTTLGFTYRSVDQRSRWSHVFLSKEQAESSAAVPDPYWEWDREPAHKTTVQEVMAHARRCGRLGVRVCSWDGKERVIIHEFPASMPLEGER